MVEVKWTDFAIQNLNEIGDYIEKKSYTSYASRVVSGLFAAVDVSRYDYKESLSG